MDDCAKPTALTRPVMRYALHDAAEQNNVALLEMLLAERQRQVDSDAMEGPPIDVNERDSSGCSPLHVAILRAAADAALWLLHNGASVRARCNGSPPLQMLVAMGAIAENVNFVTVTLANLLALMPDVVLIVDDVGRTGLHIAAATGQLAATQAILDAARTLNHASDAPAPLISLVRAVDKYGATALHAAAASRSLAVVQCLIAEVHDSDLINAIDENGDTAAHIAARGGWLQGLDMVRPQLNVARNRAGDTVDDCLSAEGFPTGAVNANDVFIGIDSSFAPISNPGTLILTHEACSAHFTCETPVTRRTSDVPPENTVRLDALLAPLHGSLRASEFDAPKTLLLESAPPVTVSLRSICSMCIACIAIHVQASAL